MQNTKGEWMQAVKRLSSRRNLNNYKLGVKVVQALGYPQFYNEKLNILDMYCGTAVFSAALHNELKPAKHIMLEPFVSYRQWLASLVDANPNLHHEREDPFRWSTFLQLEEKFGFRPETVPRSQVHDSLLFAGNLLHPQGEQLVTQYINCIANQSWIERFGRVRLLLWMRSSTAEKLVAGPGERFRHRISCQTESCCETRVVLHTKPAKLPSNYPEKLLNPLLPFNEFNHKKDLSGSSTVGQYDASLVELTPKEHQVKHIDEFDYVILKLFLLKSRPLSVCLNNLGPGASEDLGPQLQDIIHLSPQQLTLADLERITAAFVMWPFKPDTLTDFYDDNPLE